MKPSKQLVLLALAFVGTLSLYLWLINSSYFPLIESWAEENTTWFFVILFLLKVVGVIWPPLPSGFFTIGAIPLVGWVPAFTVDVIGSTVGSSLAYFLGKRWGITILDYFFDDKTIDRIKRIKIQPGRDIEAIVVLKTLMGSVVSEAVAYAAGILAIKFPRFLIGSIIGHILIGLPTYYLGYSLLESNNIWMGAAALVIVIFILVKIRRRYLIYP